MSTSTIFEFVISLSILLFVHELGHYLVGRMLGIQAEEFGFGYPPRAIKLFTWKGTDFTINLIPFGAFVRFKGEDDPKIEGGLYAANKWKRLATLLAGPLMNVLTGILLFSLVISQTGMPNFDVVEIVGIAPDSPAYRADIREGDVIMAIDDIEISDMNAVGNYIQTRLGEEVSLTLLRGETQVNVDITPRVNPPAGEGAIGIIMQNPIKQVGFIRSLPISGQLAVEQGRQLLAIPGMLLRGEVAPGEARMLSPKGIYDVYSQVREEEREMQGADARLSIMNIAWFFAVISVMLGFSNLLPIPALDGGRILFIIPEILFGKRVPAKYENLIHLIGYTSLLLLMGYTFIQDFINPVVLP